MSDVVVEASEPRRFKGFFGWLLLPVLVLVATLALGLISFPPMLQALELLSHRTATQSAVYIYSIAAAFLLGIAAPSILLVLLFRTKQQFPLLFGLWLVLAVLYLILGELLGWLAYGHPPFGPDAVTPAVVQAAAAGLWQLATRMSERLKNTFVN